MKFLPQESVLPGLLIGFALLITPPAQAQAAQETAQSLSRLGQSLCQIAFEGGLPSVDAAPLRKSARSAPERAGVCSCTAKSLSGAAPSLLSGLQAELAQDFLSHALLDDVIDDHLTPCLPQNRSTAAQTGGSDEGVGDYPFVIPAQCEMALEGEVAAWGVMPAHFTEALRSESRSREMFCACTTDQMVQNYRALSRAIQTERTEGEAFSRYLGISMTHCLRYPQPASARPAISAEALAICEAAFAEGLLNGLDTVELSRWMRGSGLSSEQLCDCAASGAVIREPDALGREDRSEVLRAVADCQRMLWRG
ncbi:hypothetical protein [Falsigemmobacter faecalis]|uniref:Uncharacterized protein n=1 Tax=Falsigemmobacter faecalis TaxID=2488730 RepID=A0A3P3DVP7_9RHOB|nr:hypothetical protein [Falsigemmobacter faecalis]RRH78249.1 hypothetical protein EG244_02050 [Falsigemmobacter faecalis]